MPARSHSYGADDWTQKVENRLRDDLREARPGGLPVATGTAANVLALACCSPPWGAIFCHPTAHIAVDEANAPEFFTSGAKLVRVDGPAGKIDPKALAEALAQPVYGVVHHPAARGGQHHPGDRNAAPSMRPKRSPPSRRRPIATG